MLDQYSKSSLPSEDANSPVTIWMRRLESGDADAAKSIWQHFCSRVCQLARQRVPSNVRRGYDEEDVAISAFHSLFIGMSKNRFDLQDREDLWRLLVTIAERKISHRIRAEYRDKRDVRRLLEDSIFLSTDQGVTSSEPTPALAAEVAESCDRLLQALPDESLRRVAILKLENFTADEIAAKLGCTRKTVQRKLLVIRQTWREAAEML